jgi:hypothetical protein
MPLPAGARVGTRPDGTLGWIDAQGNEIGPDGSAIPNAQKLTPLAPAPNTAGQTPAAPVNIAPAGSGAVPVTPPTPAASGQVPPGAAGPAQPNAPGTGVPQKGAVLGISGAPGTPGGNAQVDQITLQARQEISDANAQVTQAYNTYTDLQKKFSDTSDLATKDALSAQIVAAQTQLSTASNRVATANASYSKTLGDAITKVELTPEQAKLYTAQAGAADAQAATATAQAKVLTDGAPGQRELVTAQAGLASAQATAAITTANAAAAKTPQEQAALQAQANQANAQATQINTLLPGLIEKQKAETGLTQAQTDLTGSQSELAKAQAGQATANANLIDAQTGAQKALTPGLPAAQAATTAQAAGAGAASQAQAAAALAGIQQAKLGPLYGLEDRTKAIAAQFFRPGVDIDTATKQANDALDQYIQTQVAGTTPYAAAVAAANAGLTQFGTQASLANAASAAAAQRASSLASFGGSALGSLLTANANAPAGSTAMAGAFQEVLNMISDRMSTGAQAVPGQPTAPPLPAVLAKLAGMQQTNAGAPGGGGALAGTQGPPPPPAPAPAQPAPQQVVTGPQTQQPQTSAPVTINIGGSSPNQVPGQNYGAQTAYSGGTPPSSAQPGPSMPAYLQQQQPATMASLHQLWGQELGSGAIKSPFSAMQQQIPGPTPMAA